MDVILDNEQKFLPNAAATLTLGILSIIFSCSGIGLVLGVVGLVISKEGLRLYKENPSGWMNYGNLNAGRIMCIIGIIFGGLFLLYIVFVVIMAFLFSSTGFEQLLNP